MPWLVYVMLRLDYAMLSVNYAILPLKYAMLSVRGLRDAVPGPFSTDRCNLPGGGKAHTSPLISASVVAAFPGTHHITKTVVFCLTVACTLIITAGQRCSGRQCRSVPLAAGYVAELVMGLTYAQLAQV